MSSRTSPTTARFPPGADQGDALPPPPPLRGLPVAQSPRRRDHVAQPPTLKTTITNSLNSGYNSNPTSTTSLSSPFSQNSSSPFTGSAGGATRGISPMAARLSPTYASAPYNPQEWAPGLAGTPQPEYGQIQPLRQAALAHGRPHPDGTLASPPPPYSPRPKLDGSRMDSTSTLSPADTTYTSGTDSQLNTPLSSTVISPVVPPSGRYVRPRPTSMIQINEPTAGRGPSFFAPPPAPQTGHGSRILSKFGLDKFRSNSPTFSSFGGSSHGIPAIQQNAREIVSAATSQPDAPDPLETNTGMPPASRRAISADAVANGSNSSRATSVESRESLRKASWSTELGMVLPGPPPGPPPSATRSQSASAVPGAPPPQLSLRPRKRLAPSLGTSLGPVPPTPADWADNSTLLRPGPLHIDTGNNYSRSTTPGLGASNATISLSAPPRESSSGPGLFRSVAVRDNCFSARGFRERRSASKGAVDWPLETPDGESTVSNNPWADALYVNTPAEQVAEDLSRTREVEILETTGTDDCTPAPAPTEAPPQAAGIDTTSGRVDPSPRNDPPRLKIPVNRFISNPSFSAGAGPSSPTLETNRSRVPHGLSQRMNASRFRPISHILHTPTDTQGLPEPLTPLRMARPKSPAGKNIPNGDSDQFITESIARHRSFLEKEHLARDDQERLFLFSEYILAESRIRRRRYSKTWASGGFDVRSVKERLFEQTAPNASRSSSVSESTAFNTSEPPTPASSFSAHGRPDNQWWSSYQPALSPIASMSNDEVSSRGRTSSRWWESRDGSDIDGEGAARKFERSKRESKYMGFQRDALQTEIPEIDTPSDLPIELDDDGEYLEEKTDPDTFGFYEENNRRTPLPAQYGKQPGSPNKLDVSRFVTLPPPYPRHYPAVNNAHPALVSYRTAVRAHSDLSEVTARKARNRLSGEALQKNMLEQVADNRRRFRGNIQAQIDEGSISYAEAAEAEQALKLEEHQIEKQAVQAEFDSFQDVVLNPLHDLLNDRIGILTRCIKELQDMLFSEARSINPDQTQEEGDEEPELLEKLTQLKWLFEAREQVYKELYDLLTQRNEKYKAIVLLPYQQAENTEKVKNTIMFFAQDNQDRQTAYHNDCLKRHEEFLKVIESNVSRGVELQSSTFWDIAPGILDLLQKIPEDLDHFEGIQIPDQEYEENPSYVTYPFQYLYSLLCHAEKSTYQFMESQTNLHCLLHEAKTGLVSVSAKAADAQRPGEDTTEWKTLQEANLTAELRQKTSMIEEQWTDALGSQIGGTRERVKTWLVVQGGWDDTMQGEE